jgi:hypothetical protein
VTAPEDALARARAAAAQMRAAGRYQDADSLRAAAPHDRDTAEMRLYRWAMLDPDLRQVRSLRRWGAPITWVKRLLLRLLVQYHVQLLGDQTRFNMMLVGYVRLLEDRIEELEGVTSPPGRDRPGGDLHRATASGDGIDAGAVAGAGER